MLETADRGTGRPVADDADSDAEPAADGERPPRGGTSGSWLQQNRTLAVVVGCVAASGVIALDVYLMLKSDAKRGALASASSGSVPPAPVVSARETPVPDAAQAGEPVADGSLGEMDFESDDGEPRTGKPPPRKHFKTVQQAAVESCTTASVEGLSRQIIAQARCIKPNAFVPLPSRPNLVIASQVFPYLEANARDRLLKVLDTKPKQKMTVNSALRTVAQQFLVWRWSATKRCGVPLATPPGRSNHEIGTALDIAEAGTWRPVLEQHGFKWLGASDRVHYDYKGASTAARGGTEVLAFQRLWNRNHPKDKLNEDGRYSPAVEQRLKQAPPDGFAIGPSCSKR